MKEEKMSSAIPTISVKAIRKLLEKLRKSWRRRHDDSDGEPGFSLVLPLSDRYNVSQFAFEFTLGNHMKRHKTKQSSRK